MGALSMEARIVTGKQRLYRRALRRSFIFVEASIAGAPTHFASSHLKRSWTIALWVLWAGLAPQPVLNGVERQFEPVRDRELIENAVQIILNGEVVDEKHFGDVVVAIAL